MHGEPISFIAAMKQIFGLLPGQTLHEFRDEIKALTPKDREDLIKALQPMMQVRSE